MRRTYNITKEFLQEQFFDMRKSQKQISLELGCHISVVERAMKKHNLTRQLENRYKSKIDLMNIGNEYFCYLLGLFISDGTIKEDGRISIKLRDSDVLKVLSKYFDLPIYTTSSGTELVIPKCINLPIFQSLFNGEKNSTVTLPQVDRIIFMLRGIIDGDGCIDQSGNRLRIGMCSRSAIIGLKNKFNSIFKASVTINVSILKSEKFFYTLTLIPALIPLTKIYQDIPELSLQRKRNIIKNKVNDIVRTAEMINLQKWG